MDRRLDLKTSAPQGRQFESATLLQKETDG